MVVDATWPSSAAPLGMPVKREFNEGQDMAVACVPIDTYEVSVDQDSQEFKERLIAEFCGVSSKVRDDSI